MPALTADAARELIAGLHAKEEAAGRYGYGYPVCMYAQEALTKGRAAVLFPGYQNQAGLLLAQAINTGRDEIGRTPEQIVAAMVARRNGLENDVLAGLVCLNRKAFTLVDRLKTLAANERAKLNAGRAIARAAA